MTQFNMRDQAASRHGPGFGHVGFLVDDVGLAVLQLDPLGYGFVKRPENQNRDHTLEKGPKNFHVSQYSNFRLKLFFINLSSNI